MSLTNLSLSDLKTITKLLEKKEKLQTELNAIDDQLLAFENGVKPRKKKSADGGKIRKAVVRQGSRRRGPKGAVREQIIAALKAAGSDGLHVKEIAEKAKLPLNNVRTWFHVTGKKIEEIKPVKRATYKWEE